MKEEIQALKSAVSQNNEAKARLEKKIKEAINSVLWNNAVDTVHIAHDGLTFDVYGNFNGCP